MELSVFVEIMRAAERIDKVIRGLEELFDTQFGDSILIKTQTDLLDVLVYRCEWPDAEEDSIIYRYCFEDNWGEKPRTYYVQGEKRIVNSPETLYNYLIENYEYHEGR